MSTGGEAKPVDIEPEVPDEVIGRCCYHEKCVWRTRIVHAKTAAIQLYRNAFSTEVLSAHEPVENPHKLSRELWKWIRRYVSLRLRLYEPDTILAENPPPLRSRKAVDYVVNTVENIMENYTEMISRRSHQLPETGWRYFSDEGKCRSVFLVDPRYVELFLGDAKKYASRTAVNVAFCDEKNCYPVWKGIFPSKDYLSPAFYLVRHDVVTELAKRYGAWNFWDYVDLVAQPEESGISTYPGRRWSKVNLFFKVKDPARHAVTLSKLQSSVAKAVDQLMLISVEMLPPSTEPPGELDLDWDAMKKAVEEYIRKRREKKTWFETL